MHGVPDLQLYMRALTMVCCTGCPILAAAARVGRYDTVLAIASSAGAAVIRRSVSSAASFSSERAVSVICDL